MPTILVTGGTGTLGRPTVDRLRTGDDDVRVLSRKRGPGLATGDLFTGEGIDAAVKGADVVVHLATSRGKGDVAMARTLLTALEAAGTPHLVLVSIVGIDRIPLGYYRAKLEVERLVEQSPVPSTILRATQFHQLIDEILRAQRLLPVLLAPAITLQPIAVEDIAERLAEVTRGTPTGRVPDIGGPEQQSGVAFARLWKESRRSRKPVVPLRVPGKTFRAYASGAPLVDGTPYGRRTFADYLRSAR